MFLWRTHKFFVSCKESHISPTALCRTLLSVKSDLTFHSFNYGQQKCHVKSGTTHLLFNYCKQQCHVKSGPTFQLVQYCQQQYHPLTTVVSRILKLLFLSLLVLQETEIKKLKIQSTLVISTSVISNNHLSRRENLILVLTLKSNIR